MPSADWNRASVGVARSRPNEAEEVRTGPGPERKLEGGVEVDIVAPSPSLSAWLQEFSRTWFPPYPPDMEARSQLQSHSPEEVCPPRRLCCTPPPGGGGRAGQLVLVSVIVSPVHLN